LKPKDRDMVETRDGLLFVVVGYLHPPKRVEGGHSVHPRP